MKKQHHLLFYKLLFFGIIVLFLCACKKSISINKKTIEKQSPNVILIMADDQGYGDFSCHGNPLLKTPNLDQLQSESVRFTDFHVAPMCTPTRGQLMTGKDAMRNGATAVCQGRSMIRNGIPLMPEYFAKAGYTTGHFGKWHLGDSYPFRPQDRGFQETIHHPAWGITSLADHFGNSYWNPWLRHNGVEEKFEGYCTDIFFAEAMKWMKKQKANQQPFFLYLPTNTPHVPNWVGEKYAEPYQKIGTYKGKEVPSNFYGMIANIDENMGKLEKFLVEQNLKDNTILIYLTDNGTQSRKAAEIYNAGMRGNKTQMYEGGHRVACFIRWNAGQLQHGTAINELTQVQDILPTLIEFCGLPKADDEALDGQSLADLLTGAEKTMPDRKLVIQYSFQGTSAKKWERAIVLWNKWRLLGEDELYYIETDPGQQNNIADQQPEIAQSLRAHYETWYAKTKPIYDQKRYIHLGTKNANPMMLYSNDWQGGYCDNPPNLVKANTTGYWDVVIETAGEYEIELRRWPEESGLALAAGVQGESIKAHENFKGIVGARPIAFANLKIGEFEQTKATKVADTFVSFTTKLQVGKAKLETLFSDENKETLCSAIYVKVRKIGA